MNPSKILVLMHIKIDKWDRRRILVTGALAMAVCMLCITIVSAIYNQQLVNKAPEYGTVNQTTSTVTDTAASYAILALLCVFIAFFALSWLVYTLIIKSYHILSNIHNRGPIGWIYPAEIYPQMIRANAMGVTTSCSYLFNLFVSLVSPVMFREILWGTYLFFCFICLIMAAVVHKCYPETRVKRKITGFQMIRLLNNSFMHRVDL